MKFERLGDIITIKKGKKPLFTDAPSAESIRVLQIDDLRNDNNIKYTDEKTGVFANEDDILLAWDGANAGTIGYGKKGYIGSTIALLRKNVPENYSTVFIGKFLQSQFDYLRSKSTGATIPHIDGKSLRDLTIPKIPISDQIRVAEILNHAESLIALRKQSISSLDELLKSTFLDMFGDPVRNEKKWERNPFVNYTIRITKGESPKWQGFGYLEEGVRFITSENVLWGSMDLNKAKYIHIDFHNKLKRSQLIENDLLVNLVGASVGRTALLPKEALPANINQAVAAIALQKELINPLFVLQLFLTKSFQRELLGNVVDAARANLSLGDLRDLKIPVPPIELQDKFANIVEKVEALKTQYQQSLLELQNMYGVLSQKAFTGELK